ncbi:basic leucine zipper and W2 domains 2, isoform CRA_b [Rattus norvegicus]|uniref:Basic leucine zipper and W2 domains 2, isoform CRA_b n=1 Tax=Rattus norvegicus TaxID=10116 RepID=A6HBA8_RAT|nr:basic leucine zipper and W2 domains 2, isoform CRA_b [Rattus norvegicus]
MSPAHCLKKKKKNRHTFSVGNAEVFGEGNLASVCTKEISDRQGLPLRGDVSFLFCLNGALRHQLLHLGLYLSLYAN